MTDQPRYNRVLLKLSGEALMGDGQYGISSDTVSRIACDVKEVVRSGIQVCVVVGGGNIFRGVSVAAAGMERTTADYMGMLATVMNSLALQNALERMEVPTRVQSAIPMDMVAEPYIRRRAERHMERGRVVVFAAGSGNPYFTTDTAAALRASEMKCDLLLKGTKVDGVYSADPAKDSGAEYYEHLDYKKVLMEDLRVMDTSAIALTRENNIPVIIFSIYEKGSFARVLRGGGRFTMVQNEE